MQKSTGCKHKRKFYEFGAVFYRQKMIESAINRIAGLVLNITINYIIIELFYRIKV